MISMKGYSAIMRCIGRIEGIASCEEDEIQASLIMNADRICEILEAEMASEGESPTRFAGAPFRQGGHSPSEEPEAPRCRLDLIRTMPMRELAEYLGREVGGGFDWLGWLTEPIGRKGEHHEEKPRTP